MVIKHDLVPLYIIMQEGTGVDRNCDDVMIKLNAAVFPNHRFYQKYMAPSLT